MTNESKVAAIYHDFSGLKKLKRQAQHNDSQALKKVAQQFESMFLKMMLKSARSSMESMKSDLLNSETMKFYQGMYDDQLALHLSNQDNGVGIASMLVKQLQKHTRSADTAENKIGINQAEISSTELRRHSVTGTTALPSELISSKRSQHETSEDFVKSIWPHAKKASELLKTDPKVLVAQAALETNWGKKVIAHASGESSHNLFGIKADSDWKADKAETTTHEYINNKRFNIVDSFRSYKNYAESFMDYVDFIKTNNRYQKALASTHDPKQYTLELQKAGYATDPNYSDKIISIMNGKTFGKALEKLN